MEYPKRIMRASEVAKFLGVKTSNISRLICFPGQKFAYKMNPNKSNSPVMIDTAEYERWRQRQIKTSSRR